MSEGPVSDDGARGTPVLRTARLALRHLTPFDAPFLVQLLNDPAFLRYIGDRGVRTEADAVRYVESGPVAREGSGGIGLFAVDAGGAPAGICGLLRRDTLEGPDLGFAFLPGSRRRGFAEEAARAVLEHARATLGLPRVLAITSPDNDASIALLQKLGFRFERPGRLTPDAAEVCVFALALEPTP